MKVLYSMLITLKDMPVLIQPTNLNKLLFTKDYPKSHELEKHWVVSIFLRANS